LAVSALDNLVKAAENGDIEAVRAILDADESLARQKDKTGATALHYAAFHGRRGLVKLLIERGADINSTDTTFHATPAGWAIEYLREMGGQLAIELDDLAWAIELKDAHWVARFLKRFPSLRDASDTKGTPFRKLARESGDPEIARLFGLDA
jgi:ankyrin repeat protein